MNEVEEALCGAAKAGNTCTRKLLHEGSHGMEVAPGLIFAPWPNLGVESGVTFPYACDSCYRPVTMRMLADGCTFDCPCGQSATIDRTGWSRTEFSIWPAEVTRAHIDYQVADWRWIDGARLRAGLITEEEMAAREVKIVELERAALAGLLDASSAGSRWWRALRRFFR